MADLDLIDNSAVPTCDLPGYLSSEPDASRLFDNIQSMVPAVTTDMVALVVWNTIEDFYQRSTYRREHVYWRMDPGVMTLSFDPYDQNWRVCRFLGYSGPQRMKFEPPGRIRDLSSPPPDSVRNGQVLLALKPESIQVRLPYDVWTNYFECLLNGALSRLYMQPGKPWSDIKAMSLHAALYRKDVAGARAQAQAGNVRDGVSWSFPYFAKGGHASGRYGGYTDGR